AATTCCLMTSSNWLCPPWHTGWSWLISSTPPVACARRRNEWSWTCSIGCPSRGDGEPFQGFHVNTVAALVPAASPLPPHPRGQVVHRGHAGPRLRCGQRRHQPALPHLRHVAVSPAGQRRAVRSVPAPHGGDPAPASRHPRGNTFSGGHRGPQREETHPRILAGSRRSGGREARRSALLLPEGPSRPRT